MNDTKENTDINFRSKFKKIIAEEDMETVREFFSDYCKSTGPKDAEEFLWVLSWIDGIKLAKGENETIERKRELLENLGLNLDIIPIDKIGVLINELRYQYEQAHPLCFTMHVDQEFVEEKLRKLISKTNIVVGNVVCKKCFRRVRSATGLERIINSLGSQDEEQCIRGLKETGFTIDEAEYLKQFHIEIRDLMESIDKWNQKVNDSVKSKGQQNSSANATAEEDEPQPAIKKGQEEKAQDSDKVTCTSQHVCETANEPAESTNVPETTTYKKLTYEDVLKNKQLFDAVTRSDVLEKIKAIQKMGLDLNEIFKKITEIAILIDAANTL